VAAKPFQITVRALGKDGYQVVFRPYGNEPMILKEFGSHERVAANAYKQGLTDGMIVLRDLMSAAIKSAVAGQ
jgi:hypothetical protein